MPYPIKVCVVCGEEFELRPGKPGFANRCLQCTEDEESAAKGAGAVNTTASSDPGLNAERRRVIRDLLYRGE